MRKVTEQVVGAFVRGESRTVGNTSTDGQRLWLHGNLIAAKHGEGYAMTLAGWNTPTTRDRLNGLCDLIGAGRFYQRDWEPFYNGEPVDAYGTVAVNVPAGLTYINSQSLRDYLYS